MESNLKIFIFTSLSEKAWKANSTIDLKTFKVLGCTDSTDFDESHKPFQALHNRQSGTVYDIFKLTMAHISGVLLITINRAFPDKGTGKLSLLVEDITTYTGCRLTCIHPLDRSEGDKRPTTVAKKDKQIAELFNGVTGFCNLFLPSLKKFHSLVPLVLICLVLPLMV